MVAVLVVYVWSLPSFVHFVFLVEFVWGVVIFFLDTTILSQGNSCS